MKNINFDIFNSIFSLARMFYYHSAYDKAETIALGLQSVDDKNMLPKLLLAALNFEKGNYSLAANYYRIIAQEPAYALTGRLGLLASFFSLKDYDRANSLLGELKSHTNQLPIEQKKFFDLYANQLKKVEISK